LRGFLGIHPFFTVASPEIARYAWVLVVAMKLIAFITATCMLLGTYALTSLHRRLVGVLDRWGREPVDRWSPVLPSSSK
jgi:hypothetical protein